MSWLKKLFWSQNLPKKPKCITKSKKIKKKKRKTSDRNSYGKTGQAYLKDYFENYIDISIGNMYILQIDSISSVVKRLFIAFPPA